LTSANNVFIPVYVRTNSGDTTNRTDVFAIAMRSLPLAADLGGTRTFRAAAAPVAQLDAEFRQRVHENLVRTMERRIPGWSQRLNAR
jgi:hypothetical protein